MAFTPILHQGDATCYIRRKRERNFKTKRRRSFTIHPGQMHPATWVNELGDPFAALAAAVVYFAVKDMRAGKDVSDFFDCLGFEALADGLGWNIETFKQLLRGI